MVSLPVIASLVMDRDPAVPDPDIGNGIVAGFGVHHPSAIDHEIVGLRQYGASDQEQGAAAEYCEPVHLETSPC
jgi:hypothetical protein